MLTSQENTIHAVAIVTGLQISAAKTASAELTIDATFYTKSM